MSSSSGLSLPCAVKRLNKIASPSLAEKWDNVGLLVEPATPKAIATVMLTNDLTEVVLDEAVSVGADLILSYHPPVFRPLKRITSSDWKGRIVAKCLENRMAIYSPHTAYDVVAGGVADWLISCYDGDVSVLTAKQESRHPDGVSHVVSVRGVGPLDHHPAVRALFALDGVRLRFLDADGGSAEALCTSSALPAVTAALKEVVPNRDAAEVTVVATEKHTMSKQGVGRTVTLKEETTLRQVVATAKKHCGLDKVRLAVAEGKDMDSPVKSISCCPGSGSSVLNPAALSSDVWLTGEMSHHEMLDATHAGVSVILAEHSNSERGFLPAWLKPKVERALSEPEEGATVERKVKVVVSQKDKDPVLIV